MDLVTLFKEVEPLKKSLAAQMDYKQLRMSYEDVLGFMDDKIIHVFIKYSKTKSDPELKGLTITSLQNVRHRLYRQYNKFVSIPENLVITEEDPIEERTFEALFETLEGAFQKSQTELVKIILLPPGYILSKVNDPGKRIPSHLYLEYLDLPVTKQTVKSFNTFRRELLDFIRTNINPHTLKLKLKHI